MISFSPDIKINLHRQLLDDLNTAREVIVTQSEFISELSTKCEKLQSELAETQAAYAKLLAGNRSEKFVNPAQQLLDFSDDPELQVVLEAAKREAVWKASHPEAIRTYREVERRDKAEQARLRNAARRLLA